MVRGGSTNPIDQAVDFFFMGDLDSAIEKATSKTWPNRFHRGRSRGDEWEDPIWAPITSDPEIAARLSEMKREKQQGREQIAAMLEEPEWNR